MNNKGGDLFLNNLEAERRKRLRMMNFARYWDMMCRSRPYDWMDMHILKGEIKN